MIKVLIVCSGNAKNFSFEINQAFIYDQINSIKLLDSSIDFDYFFIKGKGWKGYLKNLSLLNKKIKSNNFDFIHAHSGDSVLLSVLQRKIPVIGTFHGSDLNNNFNRLFSNIANILTKISIVVSKDLYNKILLKSKVEIIPCGVDFKIFFPISKNDARNKMKISLNDKIILFSSSFNNKVKNYPLAKKAIENLTKIKNLKLVELKGYKRSEINLLMNAADVALMTSFTEGSPQFIKESMACNLPIVSTDIGDVKHNIEKTNGCYITSHDSKEISIKLQKALMFKKSTSGRKDIKHLDNKIIARKILKVYKDIKIKK